MGDIGLAMTAIACILENYYIVLDESGHCQQEWIACAGGSFPLALADWIADNLVSQKILLVQLCQDSMHQELSKLGLPKKDHKWVRLAIGSKADVIVTDDIDLFDPTKKGASKKVADRIKISQRGPVSNHLRKKQKIDVIIPASVPAYIASY